ncbi:MAG: hypothetical protein A2X08_07680 [Bacteroidetes bacterium GWA2_32_17]|nr:MAG: hypothetical protein A2X08_07680 [Bacteroidetes bacterium GWA2_32_17]
MERLNFNKEWDFITTEIHKEIPNKKKLVKRELLFTLELQLSKLYISKDERFYKELKEIYQNS